jgi:predicted nucleic acid-binding protein
VSALYVDSSALLKRLFAEKESGMVRALLADRVDRGDVIATSELAWVEVARAVRRAGVTDVDSAVNSACSGIARQRLDSTILERARHSGPASLSSLDALHLAAAVALGATQMLTFDQRLAAAAESLGVRAAP